MAKDLIVRRLFNELLYDHCIDYPGMMEILVDSILQSELSPILKDVYFYQFKNPDTSLMSTLYELYRDGDLDVILRNYHQLQISTQYYHALAESLQGYEKKYNAAVIKIAILKRQNARLLKRNSELYEKTKKKNKTPTL